MKMNEFDIEELENYFELRKLLCPVDEPSWN